MDDTAIMTMEIRLNNKWYFYKRITYNFNEWLESIGSLINAIEKLIWWIIIFWSGRMFWLKVVENQFDRRNDKAHPLLGEKNRNEGYLNKIKGMHVLPTIDHDEDFYKMVETNSKDEEKLKRMSEIPFDSKDVVPNVCCLVFFEYFVAPFKCCCKKRIETSHLGHHVRSFKTGINKIDDGNDIYNFRKRHHTAK